MSRTERLPDLNETRVFITIVEQGSLTAAAEVLQQPKSTVSRKLASLEERLGLRLLQRTTRSIGLTPAGQRYFQRAQRLINALAEAETEVRTAQSNPSGHLRISVNYEFGIGFLTPLVKGFLRTYPQVDLEVDLSNQFVDLIEGDFDLAIRGGSLNNSSLIARKLGPALGVLCASPEYLVKHGVPTEPEQLKDHQCIYRSGSPRETVWLFNGEYGTIRVPISGSYGVNDRLMMKQAAMTNLGLARLPAYLVVDELRAGTLISVLNDWQPSENGVYLVYPSRRLVSAAARAFIDYSCESLSPPPWLARKYQLI